MKRSRACEDLVALETQKRNKTIETTWPTTLLTRTASAEEELSRLLEAHALQSFQHSHPLVAFPDPLMDDDSDLTDCLGLRPLHRSDTRAVSLLERDVRASQEALAFKRSTKFDAPDLLQNSPDTTDHIFHDCFFAQRRRQQSMDSPVFDMSSFRQVLEPQTAI